MTAPVLYVRDGSRFVPVDDRPSPLLVDVPPIPVPLPVPDVGDAAVPTADRPVVETAPGHYRLYAPRCPHGHFARWARTNCRRCIREESRRAR